MKMSLLFYSLTMFSITFVLTCQWPINKVTKKIPRTRLHMNMLSDNQYNVAVLGDFHFNPRFMDDHKEGQKHIKEILHNGQKSNSVVVSLGDLGESKALFENSDELFSGTTECFELARDYLTEFKVPYEVVGGNHDLEGIDEFPTDDSNMEAYLRILNKEAPQFKRLIAPKTLLLGLGSVHFRLTKYTSHEVFIDDAQITWFEEQVKLHRASEGWNVFVFSHAPPMGSGLRVLQENHVVNGCCWLNHSCERSTRRFIEIVRQNHCIKAWFSGHFHLGHDYEDSITDPTGANRGDCVFVQTGVMSRKTSRDERRQSRLLRGNEDGFEICTVDHAKEGTIRIDCAVTYNKNKSGPSDVKKFHVSMEQGSEKFFSAYTPKKEDGCYIEDPEYSIDDINTAVCWWTMSDGRVLGKHDGMLLEYDPSTLAPLGLVVGKDELGDRQIAILDSGIETKDPARPVYKNREQAIVLYKEGSMEHVTVIQPNEDGSYWRKIVRNKVVRMREKRREKAAMKFVRSINKLPAETPIRITNSWGPYTTTDGDAKQRTRAPESLPVESDTKATPTITYNTVTF